MDRRSFIAAPEQPGTVQPPASIALLSAIKEHRIARIMAENLWAEAEDATRSGRTSGGLGEGKVLFSYFEGILGMPACPLFTDEERLQMDAAFQKEDAALLAVLEYPARSKKDRLAKAQYVLDTCGRMELEARHVMALCRSEFEAVA